MIFDGFYVCVYWRCLIILFLEMGRDGVLKPMDAEQLRENAHKMVDFIADYYKNIETFPVLSQVEVCFSSVL